MKNICKHIFRALSLVLILSVFSLGLISCSNKQANDTDTQSKVEITVNDSEKDDGATNITMKENQILKIYKLKNTTIFNEVNAENKSEIIAFFKTKDMNGVYNAVKKLGFDSFIENHFIIHNSALENYIAISTDQTIIESYTINEFGIFVETESPAFNYNLISSIEYDKDGKCYIQLKFIYSNSLSDNKIIETPLLITIELEQVATSIITK